MRAKQNSSLPSPAITSLQVADQFMSMAESDRVTDEFMSIADRVTICSAMQKVTRPRMLTQMPCFLKRTARILIAARRRLLRILTKAKKRGVGIGESQHISEYIAAHGRLLMFLTKFKTHGVGIVEPQHISEYVSSILNESSTELRSKDFREILRSIREVVVLPFGVALALHPGDVDWEYILVKDDSLDVETLALSDYSNYRWKSMNGSEEAGEALLHVIKPPPVVIHGSVISSGRSQSKSQKSASQSKMMKQ